MTLMSKVRDSGMPGEEYWESLFSVDDIIHKMRINSEIFNLVEIGFGYGTFTVPMAKMIKGKLFAFDIEGELSENFSKRLNSNNIKNTEYKIQDVLTQGTGLGDSDVDYFALFNIMHHEHPEQFLKEAFRVLKPGALCGIIHWRSDITTPRGPSLDIRPKPEFIEFLLVNNGFEIEENKILLEPYHFGIIGRKKL
ncbi:methyltransferase domain protein [Leptospira weilii serovar Ranarum str. ICFT]|uniref:Methyltransferase domain protein n=1 Tax=Leptospira weilii serovar Ranarum str. ICFT TaxID=1218598 RepID=N1WGL5_9LEPT|nr:class I SAM-dependent methyltransferase [Leptospira weilii]EMY78100.1 methyltransferase domain protein [Leptospira weilii serovar Ranarum str. ICFT]